MRRIAGWTLCLLLVLICAAGMADVKISIINFPDDAFRAVVQEQFDRDGDGILSDEEIGAAKTIRVWRETEITDMTGLEYFTYLEELSCSDVKIAVLDVSANTKLKELECTGCLLTKLNLKTNTALEELSCRSNQITRLDLSHNRKIRKLDCSANCLKKLDVSKLANLEELICSENELTALKVSGNTKLTYLDCRKNKLSKIDVRKNTALKTLLLNNNENISTLDVSKNTKLVDLQCLDNQLTTLNVEKNKALKVLYCSFNKLTTIDVSKNSALINLAIDNNQITSVKLNKNLQSLFCDQNKLASLDVSGMRNLLLLSCGYNPLRQLDIRKCRFLNRMVNRIGNPEYYMGVKEWREDYHHDIGNLTWMTIYLSIPKSAKLVTGPDEPAVASFKLNKSKATLQTGQKLKLKMKKVKPSGADCKDVFWKSSDESVATVSSSGVVKAKGAGTCTVTCTVNDENSASAECVITVK